MFKKFLAIFFSLAILAPCIFFMPNNSAKAVPISGKINILVDAGHWGNGNTITHTVNGTTFTYRESQRMWQLQEYLVSALNTYRGIHAERLRTNVNDNYSTNAGTDNLERGKAASGYDMFIQLHSNASDSSSTAWPVLFYPMDGRNDTKAFGQNIVRTTQRVMGLPRRPGTDTDATTYVNSSGNEYYAVMRGANLVNCPRYFILENGFHTNPESAYWLMDNSNLQTLANELAKTIAAEFGIYIPDGTYFIKNKKSGLVLDVANFAYKNASNVLQFTKYTTNDNQKWQIRDLGNGYVQFIPMHAPNMRLNVNPDTNSNGNIDIWDGANDNAIGMHFKIEKVGDYYAIKSRVSNGARCVDVENSSTSPDANICHYTYLGTDSQLWTFEPAEMNSVALKAKGTSLYLYMYPITTGPNGPVTLSSAKDIFFKFIYHQDGFYIYNTKYGVYLMLRPDGTVGYTTSPIDMFSEWNISRNDYGYAISNCQNGLMLGTSGSSPIFLNGVMQYWDLVT